MPGKSRWTRGKVRSPGSTPCSVRYGYDGSLVATFTNVLMFVEPDGLKPLPAMPETLKDRRVVLFVRGRDIDIAFLDSPYDGFIRLPHQ